MTLRLNGSTSGYVEIDAPAVAGTTSVTIPATSGEAVIKGADGSVDLGSVDIDSSGRLLVGTSSATSSGLIQAVDVAGAELTLARNDASVVAGNQLGRISWFGNDGGTYEECGRITCEADLDHAAGDKPSRLVFSTTPDGASSPTERMRITSAGKVGVNNPDTNIAAEAFQVGAAATAGYCIATVVSVPGSRFHHRFINENGAVGSIKTDGSATSFNTSSDYRLKENVVPLTGAADRVNQLQVHRFNFIADPDKTVDGFIAHEAQAVVPECVTGTKDEVDADGNPVYQGIDQSKLVPLLTAALQEALAEIENLKTRLTALEAQP